MTGGPDVGWRPALPAQPSVETVEGYRDLVEVGRGGDSVVYRATQVAMSREVALKVLLVDDADRVARFEREVQITVELGRQHPNIVNLLATAVTTAGRPCLVMDYYPAGTLHDRLREHGPLPVDEVITIGTVLADALAFAHDRGVLHRDVKPQNVLVLPTSWVLADFGIARLTDSEHTHSIETFTYRHAAPQILDGLPPTAADDVWSLGSTLFTLIDGRPPFASDDPDDDTALAYLRRARIEPHRRLTAPGSERIASIIDRCLAKDVAQRWGSAAELREALSAVRTTAWLPAGSPEAPATSVAGAQEEVRSPEPPRPSDREWAPDVTRRRPDDRGLPAPAGAAGGWAISPIAGRPVEGGPVEGGPVDGGPEPVALSVLAHAPEVESDAEPTGVPPIEPPRAPIGSPPGPARPRRRGLLVLGIVALTVGLVLGIGGALLRRGNGDASTAGTSSAPGPEPIGSLTALPTASGDPQVPKLDPRLRFVIRTLRYNGSGIDIAWRDPSDGKGYFVLYQTVPGPERPLARFDPGTPSTAWSMVAKPGARYCFAMTVHLPTGEIGAAPVRCIRI